MKIKDVMTHRASSVDAAMSLADAARVMLRDGVSCLLICDWDRLVGSITDHDIVVGGLAAGHDPERTPVRNIMSLGIASIFEDQDVAEAVRVMVEKKLQRLPVLNRSNRLVGMVTAADLAAGAKKAPAPREICEPIRNELEPFRFSYIDSSRWDDGLRPLW